MKELLLAQIFNDSIEYLDYALLHCFFNVCRELYEELWLDWQHCINFLVPELSVEVGCQYNVITCVIQYLWQ